MRLLVTGGQQRRALTMGDRLNGDWYEYGRAVAAVVDTESGAVEVVAEVAAEVATPSFGDQLTFKGASISGDELLICTMTDVRRFDATTFAPVGAPITGWFMNDVHHAVRARSGALLIANSGRDSCVEVDDLGRLISVWAGLPQSDEERVEDDAVDYRLVSTKPHQCHPNQVFEYDGDAWMTRFHQRDAITLDGRRRIDVGLERMHDGLVVDDQVVFTTVDAKIVRTRPDTGHDHEIVDLRTIDGREENLGWLRGLAVSAPDSSSFWVGFSRIRPSKWRGNLQFIKNGFAASLPTRVARYDLDRQIMDGEIDLEPHGLDAVFSVLALD